MKTEYSTDEKLHESKLFKRHICSSDTRQNLVKTGQGPRFNIAFTIWTNSSQS